MKRSDLINRAVLLVSGAGVHKTPMLISALRLLVLGYLKRAPSGEFTCRSRGTSTEYRCSASVCECLAFTHGTLCAHRVAVDLWLQAAASLDK